MSPPRNQVRLGIALALALLPQPKMQAYAGNNPGGQTLELDVVINGYPIGKIGEFVEKSGVLFATHHEIQSLGFLAQKADLQDPASAEMSLTAIPGVSYRVNAKTQTVFMAVPNKYLEPTILQAQPNPNEPETPAESGIGVDLNYDGIVTDLGNQTLAQLSLDAHAFSPWGLLSASATATAGAQTGLPPLLRLNTNYSYADVRRLRRYIVGDFIGGGLNWSRPVRMAGLQIGSDFSVQPDLVTFPLPTIEGQVAVPSSVQVLINGVQLISQNIPRGPFQINQLPVVSGSGDISVVTRDEAGRQTTETLPFYSSQSLLKVGLSAYSAELGAVRLNYGFQSNDYQAPAAAFTYRYGVANWLTLKVHAEATAGNNGYTGETIGTGIMGGGGAAFTIGDFGVASFDVAASRFNRLNGTLISASIERITQRLSFTGSIQAADKNFADIAAAYGQNYPIFQGRATFGLALPHLGSLGLAFIEIQQPQSRVVPKFSYASAKASNSNFNFSILPLAPQPHVSLLSASFSRSILHGHAYAYATLFDDLSNSHSNGVMLGVSFPFASRGTASAGIGGGSNATTQTLQVTQPANNIGDVGWQVIEGSGGQSWKFANGSYKSPWGLLNAGVDQVNGQTAYRAGMQGSFAFTDGNLFATNTIYDSFAVVDTNKTKGVEILEENRPIGKTGSSGLLLIPDLRSFDVNRIGINPNNIPLDSQIGPTTQFVSPQDHSGIIVKFPIHQSHGAIIHFVDANGAYVQVGSIGHLVTHARGSDVEIGYDGEAFLTGLASHNTVIISLPDATNCIAQFRYQETAGTLPQIGPVICRRPDP